MPLPPLSPARLPSASSTPFNRCSQSGFPTGRFQECPDRRVAVAGRAGLIHDLADLGLGHQPLTGARTDSDRPCSLVLGGAEPDQLGKTVRDLFVHWFLGHGGILAPPLRRHQNDRAPSRQQPPPCDGLRRHVAEAPVELQIASTPHSVRVCAPMWRMWRMWRTPPHPPHPPHRGASPHRMRG